MQLIHKYMAPAVLLIAVVGSSAFAQAAADMADGEVRKINKDTRKITIKHGEIKSMDMPPMTMVFNVKDPALFDKVQVGDKVKFTAAKEEGQIVVTDIQKGN